MDPVAAASSSGALPEHFSEIQPFKHYLGPYFHYEPDMQSLTSDDFDKDFDTYIHYDGTPVLFTEKVTEGKVIAALDSYGKVWLVGRYDGDSKLTYVHYYANKVVGLDLGKGNRDEARKYVEAAHKFKSEHGDNALYLRYGRPFAERKRSKLFGYNVPKWKDIEKLSTPAYDLEKARFPHLRNTLDQYNYLKGYDSKNRLLGFKLDKNGNVLLEYLGQYHPRV
ncbi:uncharacterized protein UHOD_12239 [Ustilago sp. UG-2017b]|nr:uncharacterized protein UHOD_12239 [Ustilago sp. UG-2017b]